MTIQSKYDVGDTVYVSLNMLTRYDEISSISNSGPMDLNQDFPLEGVITEVTIAAKKYMNDLRNPKITAAIQYTVEIQSPAFSVNVRDSEPDYFRTISNFYEEDIFSSVEDMELYMMTKGTKLWNRGWSIREINQIIKNEIYR